MFSSIFSSNLINFLSLHRRHELQKSCISKLPVQRASAILHNFSPFSDYLFIEPFGLFGLIEKGFFFVMEGFEIFEGIDEHVFLCGIGV